MVGFVSVGGFQAANVFSPATPLSASTQEDSSDVEDVSVKAIATAAAPTPTPNTQSNQTITECVSPSNNDEDDDEGDEEEEEGEENEEDEDGDDVVCTTKIITTASAPTVSATVPSVSPTAAAKPAQSSGGYTMTQIASHNSAASCYSVVNGSVYDLTSFVANHPGGQAAIKSMCGTDATAAFAAQHGSSGKPNSVLAQFKIGKLAP